MNVWLYRLQTLGEGVMVGNAGQTGWYSLFVIVVFTVFQVGCGGLPVSNQSFAELTYRELVGDDPADGQGPRCA